MLTPDTILQERYRILGQLGQGGMGAVYEAVDQRLDTTVALKETLFVEEKLRKQFEREARLLARLHHPALPRVSDHFAEGEGAFLVMQFIAGDDLAEMITRRRGPFPPEQILLWADQLLDALDYLHTQDPQIIHRDIKPQNLKLSSRGQIILLDFGLAKGQHGELSRATTSASIFGYTPNYAPLEQVQGLGTDSRSDIYSLAATLYHLLTGIKPPDALTRAAAIVNGQPDPLLLAHEVNPAVGPSLSTVLQQAMAQNRDQRYSSAAEMRNALHTGVEGTLSTGGEAATVLFPQASSARTNIAAASPTARATAAHSGETTVVRAPRAAGMRRLRPLAIAAGVLLFAAASFGAFYAYEHRGGSGVITPVVPSVATSPPAALQSAAARESNSRESNSRESNSSEASKPNLDQKKTESSKQTTARREAGKEALARRNGKQAEQKGTAANDNHRAEVKPSPTPEVPAANIPANSDFDPNAAGARNRRGRRGMPEGVRVRTLPNGTRIVIAPNGTRVVTYPDGSTRVLRPGERIKRP